MGKSLAVRILTANSECSRTETHKECNNKADMSIAKVGNRSRRDETLDTINFLREDGREDSLK